MPCSSDQMSEINQLPYGGEHQGREVFVQSILGAMMSYAEIAITSSCRRGRRMR
jgi:uncharacterized protein